MSRRTSPPRTRKRKVSAALTYAVLIGFSVIVLFPFVVAFSTSLKAPADVYNYPPTLIPRAPATVEVTGFDEPAPLLDLEIDGETVEVALVEDGVSAGVYAPVATPDDESTYLLLDDADFVGSGERMAVLVNGREREREIGTATYEDESIEVVRVRSTTAARFVVPDDPTVEYFGLPSDGEPVKTTSLRTENFGEVLELQRLDRALTNSILVTLLVVFGQVFTSVLGGYAFARLRFKGRDQIFMMYLGSIMIPFVVLIVPLHQLMVSMGWINGIVSLIVPFIFSAYGTFLMRQFFLSIPRSLEEAALIDGASRWTILWRIMVPLSRPPIAALSAFAFLYAWNSFLWPVLTISLGNEENRVLTLALQVLGGRAGDNPHLVLAGVMIAIVPPVLAFIAAQRHFVEGVAAQGMKG